MTRNYNREDICKNIHQNTFYECSSSENWAKRSFIRHKNLDRSFFHFITINAFFDGRTDTFLVS